MNNLVLFDYRYCYGCLGIPYCYQTDYYEVTFSIWNLFSGDALSLQSIRQLPSTC